MGFREAFDSIERAAAERIKVEQGDYEVDGLLYCGKCHTPKQTRVTILGQERKPMCLCRCAAAQKEEEDAAYKRTEFEKKVKDLRRMAFADDEMQKWTFETDDGKSRKLSKVARNYVENFKELHLAGKGLLLYGGVGVGKTFAAVCIANALIDKGTPCMVTSFTRLLNVIGGIFEGKQEQIDQLNSFPLLVIDDLATQRSTEYAEELVYNVIDSRYRAGLPLIVTTNLTGAQLQNPDTAQKQRIYSRLYEMCIPIKCEGEDRRKKKLLEETERYKKLLGI